MPSTRCTRAARAAVTLALAFALAVGPAGCEATDNDGPVLAMTRNSDGAYAFARVTIPGWTASPLASAHFPMFTGVVIDLDEGKVTDHGAPMEGRFAGGDPLVPIDFEMLVAVTALYNAEASWSFYAALWRPEFPPLPQSIPIYFYPRTTASDLLAIKVDNAAYAPAFHALALWPERKLANIKLPLAMNPSVTTHEIGHAMYDTLLRSRVDGATLEDLRTRGLDEGLADTFAIAHIGNPAIMSDCGVKEMAIMHSETRDVRLESTYSDDLVGESNAIYLIGTVVARTFWLAAETRAEALGGRQAALRHGAALAARALAIHEPAGVDEPYAFFEDLLALPDLAPADHDAFCAALAKTFAVKLPNIEACP